MEKIELRKARDFGQLFNDSIAFLRINFKSFFGSVIFLAGPFVMLTGLMAGFLQYVSSAGSSPPTTAKVYRCFYQ